MTDLRSGRVSPGTPIHSAAISYTSMSPPEYTLYELVPGEDAETPSFSDFTWRTKVDMA